MSDAPRHDEAGSSARERLRHLYAHLLALPAPAPSPGGPTGSSKGSADDPFGADLFSERVFDDASRDGVIYGEGFEALTDFIPSGDGHGRPIDAGLSLPPVWALGPTPDSSPEVDAPVEIEWLLSDTIYGNPKHVANARGVAVLEDESPALPGFDALPEVPHAGMHQVIVVPFCDVGLLNERLEAGWRVAQMAPAVAPDEMVVVLRFDG